MKHISGTEVVKYPELKLADNDGILFSENEWYTIIYDVNDRSCLLFIKKEVINE